VRLSEDPMEEARRPEWRTEGRDSDNIHRMDNAQGLHSCSGQRLRKTDICIKSSMARTGQRIELCRASVVLRPRGSDLSGSHPSGMPRFASRGQLIHEVNAAVFRVSGSRNPCILRYCGPSQGLLICRRRAQNRRRGNVDSQVGRYSHIEAFQRLASCHVLPY
jgi:hypothetical protein